MSGTYDYDVIVVGTGFGGASAAESLARAGLKVGIVERGTWWGGFEGHRPLPETIPQIVAALAGLNFSGFGYSLPIPLSRRGLLEFSLHGGTIVVNSSAVGGNSVVSGAYLHRPAPQFYDALPPELTAAELAPHYERIERALQVTPAPKDERKFAVLTALADKQQWKLGPTPQGIRWTSDDPATRPPCTQCNRCMFSCNIGAKLGMDRTLLPIAIKAGAVLRDLCTVQTVESVPGGYEVRFHDAHEGRTDVLRAPRVVVAAGALNTLKILTSFRQNLTVTQLLGDGTNGSVDNTLKAGEIIKNIQLPSPLSGERALYKRAISRTHAEWPLVELVARVFVAAGHIALVRVAAEGIAPVPLRLSALEAALHGAAATAASVAHAGEQSTIGANPSLCSAAGPAATISQIRF